MSDQKKNIYFASDFHLGVPTYEKSLEREKKIVAWLNHIEPTAQEIFLVGDTFDFWFEYKHAVPKGFVRLQGKIAELTDKGIPVHVFTGNHDMWIFDYLPKELGVQLHREPITREFYGKKFLIGHGDGLGPGEGAGAEDVVELLHALGEVDGGAVGTEQCCRRHTGFGAPAATGGHVEAGLAILTFHASS